MNSNLIDKIIRAKELLKTVRHATMATVNEDGSPHNSPFFFLYNEELTKIYWGSHPESLHSQNVLRTGQIFIAVYDAIERGGFYIEADNGHILDEKELAEGLRVHNTFRAKEGKEPLPLSYYTDDKPQRMWSADVRKIWINDSIRDENERLIKDIRVEIKADDLIS